MLHLGLDIGGTKMEAVLLNAAGECVYRHAVRRIKRAIRRLCSSCSD